MRPFAFDEHGVAIGLVEVDGILALHVEGPARHEVSRTGRFIWALGVSEDGVRIAVPARDGTWAGRGRTLDAEGMRRLMANLGSGRPRDADAARTLQQAGFGPRGRSTLAERLGVGPVETVTRALNEAGLEAVLARLGPIRMGLHAMGVDGLGLDPETIAGTMTLPRRALEALDALVRQRPELAAIALLSPSLELSGALQDDVRALMAHHGLPGPLPSRLGRATPVLLPAHLRVMSVVPVDWIPLAEDAIGWDALSRVATIFDGVPDVCDDRSLLGHAKGRWPSFLAALAKAAGIPPDDPLLDRKLADACLDLRDSLALFQSEVVAPALGRRYLDEGHREALAVSVELLHGRRGLARVLAISRDLHADGIPAIGDGDYAEWPAVLPAWTDPSTGLTVHPLVDSGQLVAEGLKGPDRDGVEGLAHCVGNVAFVDACLQGHVRILSLRREGRRVSTAEVGLVPGLPVAQHRALRNGVPSAEAEATLAAYLATDEASAAGSRPPPSFPPLGIALFETREPELRQAAELALGRWRRRLVHDHAGIDLDGVRRLMKRGG